MSPSEARHEAQRSEHGHHADQGGTAALVRARHLRMADGGLVAALLGSVTRPAEIRTRDGTPLLVFSAVADGVRLAGEVATAIRVEYLGDDAESLAALLLKHSQVYVEGRLSLWEAKGGRTGLSVVASHVEVLRS